MTKLGHDDIAKGAEILQDLNHLVLKQQLLLTEAYKASLQPRPAGQKVQERLRYKPRTADTGCRARIWKQDPDVAHSVPIKTIFLPTDVEAGPSDSLIEVAFKGDKKVDGRDKLFPDSNGDLLLDEVKDPYGFDLMQAYSVVRMVINMYQRDLQRPWRWQWDEGAGSSLTPIRLLCHAGVKKNAAYLRSKKLLKFYFFEEEGSGKEIHLCRSLDIVAHETGHAVLDALKPKLYFIKDGQPGALHEAFADMTAIFTVLSQMDLCEDIIANTKGNLRSTRYLSGIGEQLGAALSETGIETEDEDVKGEANERGEEHNSVGRGVRDANNDLKGSQAREVYDIATVFTGFMYDLLVDLFEHERNPSFRDDAETLRHVARALRKVLLVGIDNTPEVPNFSDVVMGMLTAVAVIRAEATIDADFFAQAIRKRSTERELESAGERSEPNVLDDWGEI